MRGDGSTLRILGPVELIGPGGAGAARRGQGALPARGARAAPGRGGQPGPAGRGAVGRARAPFRRQRAAELCPSAAARPPGRPKGCRSSPTPRVPAGGASRRGGCAAGRAADRRGPRGGGRGRPGRRGAAAARGAGAVARAGAGGVLRPAVRPGGSRSPGGVARVGRARTWPTPSWPWADITTWSGSWRRWWPAIRCASGAGASCCSPVTATAGRPRRWTGFVPYGRTLRDELGVDPSPELQDLHDRILHQDPALAWRPPEQAPAPLAGPLHGRDDELRQAACGL